MKKKAVILFKGTKYNICCDVDFLQDFMNYLMTDERHRKELKIIIDLIREGLRTKKYSDEPYGTKAMKPFKNNDNDRILCNVTKRKFKTQCIVMVELHIHKNSNHNNKKLENRYKLISKYSYEIIG